MPSNYVLPPAGEERVQHFIFVIPSDSTDEIILCSRQEMQLLYGLTTRIHGDVVNTCNANIECTFFKHGILRKTRENLV